MTLSPTEPEEECADCGAPLSASSRYCPTCRADAGAPNVRACLRKGNLETLTARFIEAETLASANECSKEFTTFSNLIGQKSGVVVSVIPRIARSLVDDPRFVYTNYESLVGAGARKHANAVDDRKRCTVGAVLFGSYAKDIVYGALSLTQMGLPTYGSVHCRLRPKAINRRTSFLETNSFRFVQDHKVIVGSALPDGYRASWDDRQKLVLAKLSNLLLVGQNESDWQAILIRSDGHDRKNDDFVEAHIFESFDLNAIEAMVADIDIKPSHEEKIDIDVAIDRFKHLGGRNK